MSRLSKLISAGWCCVLLSTVLLAAEPNELAAVYPELWFPVGEQIVYRIYWGIIPVGESVVSTEWIEKDGQQLLVIRIRSKTNKVLSTFYPVDDLLESVINPETFLPLQFTKNLSEGRYKAHEVTQFDHAGGVARMQSITNDKRKEYPIEADTRDLLSFMYFMRQFPMKMGEVLKQRVMADEDIYDIEVEPQKVEKVKTVNGEWVKSLKVEPKAKFDGLFVRKGRGWMWISEEGEDRVVTRIAAEVPVANVKLVLDEVSQEDPVGDPDEVELLAW